jgi:L-rhamnono-1,4-lactonase
MPPIVDSHVHLFPRSHLPSLSWFSPDGPLASQHSVDQYRAAAAAPASSPVRGFIFLETDRISSVQESDHSWTHVLDEVSFLTRIALGEPIPGEGHRHVDRWLCLGIVPWAPVPGGPAVLERYMDLVKQRARTDAVWKKVRGVRYLVQDKPPGTMLEQGFVDGLKWLGAKGFAFDLGVDARQGGLWQLREAVETLGRVYEDAEVAFVISVFLPLFFFAVSLTSRPPLQTQSASLWLCHRPA